jgi:uncharacterized protein
LKETIELDQNIGYTYSSKHKSLIYKPSQEYYVINNSNPTKYHEEVLKLYNTPSCEKNVQFIELSPQMIKKAVSITTQLIFEVTEKCNMSCMYCALGDNYTQQVSNKRCQHMDWQTAKTVLDFYIQIWNKESPKQFKKFCYIGFHGGEPLLNMPLIKKIINYLEEHSVNMNFFYTLTTNGTLLHKHIKYLSENKFALSVSMDGNQEMNSYRVYKNGKSVYDDLFANLKEIQTKYPNYFKEYVDFISVAHSRNTDKGITSFFEEKFKKKPMIIELLSTGVANYDNWDSMRRKNMDDKKKDAHKEDDNNFYLSNYLHLFSGNFYKNYRYLLDYSTNIVKTPTATCIPFSDRAFITVKKDIIACEKIGFEHTMGKVTDDGIHIDFENLAKFYNNIYNKFKVQCENCYIKDSCDVCFLTNEQYFKENFKCEEFYPASSLKKCITESVKTLRKNTFDFNNLLNNII